MKRFLCVAGCLTMAVACGLAGLSYAWTPSPDAADWFLAGLNAAGCVAWAFMAADVTVAGDSSRAS